jgi:hypothetical protein
MNRSRETLSVLSFEMLPSLAIKVLRSSPIAS